MIFEVFFFFKDFNEIDSFTLKFNFKCAQNIVC